MKLPTVLSGILGLKSLAVEVTARLFREAATQTMGETFEDATISVGPLSRFKFCQFRKCNFEWDGEAIDARTKIFLSCNFDECDYGIPVEAFIAHSFGATIDGQYMARLTREQALEEAVRRIHHQDPSLTEQCLDPSSQAEREQLAQWVHAEYRKILMDA